VVSIFEVGKMPILEVLALGLGTTVSCKEFLNESRRRSSDRSKEDLS